MGRNSTIDAELFHSHHRGPPIEELLGEAITLAGDWDLYIRVWWKFAGQTWIVIYSDEFDKRALHPLDHAVVQALAIGAAVVELASMDATGTLRIKLWERGASIHPLLQVVRAVGPDYESWPALRGDPCEG